MLDPPRDTAPAEIQTEITALAVATSPHPSATPSTDVDQGSLRAANRSRPGAAAGTRCSAAMFTPRRLDQAPGRAGRPAASWIHRTQAGCRLGPRAGEQTLRPRPRAGGRDRWSDHRSCGGHRGGQRPGGPGGAARCCDTDDRDASTCPTRVLTSCGPSASSSSRTSRVGSARWPNTSAATATVSLPCCSGHRLAPASSSCARMFA